MMLTRTQAAAMINDHLNNGTRWPKEAWHYGRVELRELLDAIYGGEPTALEEKLLAK